MKTVVYSCPFVPPEWIAAHGFRPCRLLPAAGGARTPEGVCPYAAAFAETASGSGTAAVVVTTVCDQMRRVAEDIQGPPLFLFNVPSTWRGDNAAGLYREEIERLGRFLERAGGTAPSRDRLLDAMGRFDRTRFLLRERIPSLPPRAWAKLAADFGHDGNPDIALPPAQAASSSRAVPVALLGGPLPREDFTLFDVIERSGGRVTVNGTENGERTLPAPYDLDRMAEDPVGAITESYFGTIPDPARRPNTRFYDWVADRVRARGVRGIVVRWYSWCDLWHAEARRLHEQTGLPVVTIDTDDAAGEDARTTSRVEALLEALR